MKDFTPLLVAAIGAGVVYFFVTRNRQQFTQPPELPSPQAFTEAPIFASDVSDSAIWT
jgi:hypothetical protein